MLWGNLEPDQSRVSHRSAGRPDDTERRYREADPLIREALDHGKVLYERYE
jgi:hypothetical protein